MARGRFISESIAKDARLNSLSVEAQLVYLMTVPHLDRDGLIEGDPDVLWGIVCPKRRMFLDTMPQLIHEWATVGLVLMYDSNDGPVLWFKGFTKNQQGMRYEREAPSRFPPPPDDATPDKLPTNSGNCRPEVEVEVKDQVEIEVKDLLPNAAATHTKPLSTQVKEPTPQQEMFGAVCEAIGWDYQTLSKDDKGQVAQAVGILTKADYTIDDIRRFMVEIWFNDWRWKKEGQHPTLKQLRQEIGKIRSVVKQAAPIPKTKGLSSYERLAAGLGVSR